MRGQSKSWEEKCGELEKKLSGRETVVKHNAGLTTQVSALEHEVAQLKLDRKQMQDDSGASDSNFLRAELPRARLPKCL